MNEVWCKLSKIFEIAEGGGLADGWGDDSIVNCGCSENSMPKDLAVVSGVRPLKPFLLQSRTDGMQSDNNLKASSPRSTRLS